MRRLAFLLSALLLGFLACTDGALDAPSFPEEGREGDASVTTPLPSPTTSTPVPRPAASGDDAGGAGDAGDEPEDAAVEAEAAAPLPAYAHYDYNQVLVTGASDSVANGGNPYVSRTQPFSNVKLDVGVFTGTRCDGEGCREYRTGTSFVPLVEGDTFLPSVGGTETHGSGFANQATSLASAWFARVGLPAREHTILVTNHGRSGASYDVLHKGSSYEYQDGQKYDHYLKPFDDDGLLQIRDARKIATDLGKTHAVRAVNVLHGQADHDDDERGLREWTYRSDGTLVGNYTNALLDWQKDYEEAAQWITGQTEKVPLFLSQFGSFGGQTYSRIPQRQLDAHVQAPGKVIVVTPNYPFDQSGDCLHYRPHEQRRLGAYFARAYERVVVEGGTWEPVRPRTITRAGNVITIRFHVPSPPLVWDETRVAKAASYGFDFRDRTSSARITSVELTGPDTVQITLDAEPTGANPRISYATYKVARECPGPRTGARGNLRDSDTTPSFHTDASGKPYDLFNWAVQFDYAVE